MELEIWHDQNQDMSSSPSEQRPSKDGLLGQLKEQVFGCFGDTTAHGYGRIAAAVESRTRRWFWLIICCASFVTFAVQLGYITQQYTSRPLKTRITLTHDVKLPFPQVTICNLNIIRLSKFPKEILKEFPEVLGGDHALHQMNKTTPTKKGANSNIKKTMPDIEDLPEKEKLIQRVLQKLALIPETSLMSYGHQLKDMIMSCLFSNMECLEDDMRSYWTRFWHRDYGNCFTFNKGMDDNGEEIEVLTSSQPGLGLTLEMNIEQPEYISELSQEAGIRVFIGGQKEMPFPFQQGISVGPGFSTAIELRKVVIGRLDPFENGSCVSSNSAILKDNIFNRYNVTYTTMACKISCLAELMNERCGCIWYSLKHADDSPVCDIENPTMVDCVNGVFDEFDDGSCGKRRCTEKCRDNTFKTSSSMAKWPSRQYMNSLLADVENKAPGLHNNSGELRDHFLKLKIYYGELNYEVIEEEIAYLFESFLSDVGGLMGMWIGISVLTVVELLELTATLLYTIFKTLSKKKSQVTEVKPQKNDNVQRF